jgi:hypothetical protein
VVRRALRFAAVGLLAGAALVAGGGPAGADVLVVDAARLTVLGFQFQVGVVEGSPQTPVGGITSSLVTLQDTTAGCQASDFAGFPAGSMALIFDGGCTIDVKHLNAAASGAIGVVIAKSAPGPLEGAFQNPGVIPTGIVSQSDGLTIANLFGGTATLDLRYHFDPDPYEFSGFLGSVDDPPTVNVGKAGRVYAVTWQLSRAGAPITDLGAITSVTSKSTSCSGFSDDPADSLEATAVGSTGLRYDAGSGRFVYTWKTPKTKGCYSLFITFDNAQVVAAHFDLR